MKTPSDKEMRATLKPRLSLSNRSHARD